MLKILVSIMIAAIVPLAAADGEGHGCSNATLKGDYGFIITGSAPSGPPPAPLQQIVGVSIAHYNGDGTSTGSDNIHGSITGFVNPDRQGTGTYSIKEDCTGIGTLSNPGQPPLELRFVVVDNGKEVRIAVTSPGVMVTSVGKKI